ncbi:MAG: FG-GAP-like repeat-containing protein, partial [Thermoanaerobaculia bacterium]
VAAADLDGDRRLDLVAGARRSGADPPRLLLFRNRGDGALDPAALILEHAGLSSLSAGDVDADGDPDLVADAAGGRIAVLVNRGDASFAAPLYFHAGGSPIVVPRDLDGDGNTDLAWFNRYQPGLSIIPRPVVPPASKDLNRDGVPDECEDPPFHRGDPNGDGKNDLADAIALFEHLYLGGDAPSCLETADTDDDGAIDLSDGIALLSFLFFGGPPPPRPGPTGEPCGTDPDPPGAPGHLGCAEYRQCR